MASSPSSLGHPDVHQDDVGMAAGSLGHGLEPVAGLGDDVDVGLVGEQQPEAGPHHRLVVHHEDPDAHAGSSSNGSEARSTKPPEVAANADMSPPYALTRSPMPIRPCPDPPLRAKPPVPSSRTSSRSSLGA